MPSKKKSFSRRTLKIIKYDSTFRTPDVAYLCGADEAGRAPLAGPVVAAAVIFNEGVSVKGVYDSKMLTAEQRLELFEEIKAKALSYSISVISHKKIDKLNIYWAGVKALKDAVRKLTIKPDVALIDGKFCKGRKPKVVNVVGGDRKSFSIAAASILAKVTRDRIMCDYEAKYPNYSFSKHKGYATKKHINEIKQYGFCDIHRQSFKPKAFRVEVSGEML